MQLLTSKNKQLELENAQQLELITRLEVSLETVATHYRAVQSDKAKAIKGIEKMKS